MTSTERPTPWSIAYADGCANCYRCSLASANAQVDFEFAPTTPETSSTGTYSGGAPHRAWLVANDARIDELWSRVERLESDTASHAAARMKGTGTVTISTPAGTRTFLINRGPALEDLDRFMLRFRD